MTHLLRLCASACVMLVLTCQGRLSGQPGASPPVNPLPFPADFPPADERIWGLQWTGMMAKLAAQALGTNPDAPATMELLRQARRLDDAIQVFRRIVDGPTANLGPAITIVPALAWDVSSGLPSRGDALRELVAKAKSRLPQLPREEAARAARGLMTASGRLTSGTRGGWRDQLRTFVKDWAGTDEALLAEVDLIAGEDRTPARLDALDAFARAHPRTVAAAKAIHQRAFDLAHNSSALPIESPKGDPLARFLLVSELVNELESGRYPPCEWVERAPSLLIGFHAFQPTYAEGSVARILAIYEAFATTHFTPDDRGLGWGIGYVITRKMRDLYALNGDGIAGVERFLGELERDSSKRPSALYLRALFYLQLRHDPAAGDRTRFVGNGRTTLEALRAQSSGPLQRKALATLAVVAYEEGDREAAVRHLTEYLQSYPDSSWAWVAALRLGKAYQSGGDWTAASDAYLKAAARYASPAPARTLGYAYAATAFEALGRFDDALAQQQRALDSWDEDFGPSYSLYLGRWSRPADLSLKDESEVVKLSLSERVVQLRKVLNAPGAGLLETGRWLFERGRLDDAIATLDQLSRKYGDSVVAPDGRALLHRARVARAIDRGDRQELESLEREPYDFWISAAGMARAAMLWREGATADGDALMLMALRDWQVHQAAAMPKEAPTGLEKDILEIRNLVFRPRGDGLFAGSHWELNSLSPSLTPFYIARPELMVTFAAREPTRVSVRRPVPGLDNVLFLDPDQLAFFGTILEKIGGTETRRPAAVMEVPNQPAGGALRLLERLRTFFPARAGHWGGWMFESFPMITLIDFTNSERTSAGVRVTIGYEGATLLFEKKDGVWTYQGMTERWIT